MCSVVDFSESGCAIALSVNTTALDDSHSMNTNLELSSNLVSERLTQVVGHDDVVNA